MIERIRCLSARLRHNLGDIAHKLDPIVSGLFSGSLLVLRAHFYPNPKIEGNDPETIQNNLQWLKENCSVIPFSWGLQRLEAGTALPRRSVALVIDDAIEGFSELGAPLLRKAGIPYSLAVISGLVEHDSRDYYLARLMHLGGHRFACEGPATLRKACVFLEASTEVRRHFDLNRLFVHAADLSDQSLRDLINYTGAPDHRMMSWTELKGLQCSGQVELLVHSMSHPHLRFAKGAWLDWEVGKAKEVIENATGRGVSGFVYPYGGARDASEAVVRKLYQCGYRYGIMARDGMTSGGTDRFRIPRYDAEVPAARLRRNASAATGTVQDGSQRWNRTSSFLLSETCAWGQCI